MKREIVAASLEPGASVSRVARRYEVNANQVFAWRKLYCDGAGAPGALRLLPVTVTPAATSEMARAGCDGRIEIELAGRYRVRLGGGVKPAALRLVLDVLEGR